MSDSSGDYYSKNLDCISGCFKVTWIICGFKQYQAGGIWKLTSF